VFPTFGREKHIPERRIALDPNLPLVEGHRMSEVARLAIRRTAQRQLSGDKPYTGNAVEATQEIYTHINAESVGNMGKRVSVVCEGLYPPNLRRFEVSTLSPAFQRILCVEVVGERDLLYVSRR